MRNYFALNFLGWVVATALALRLLMAAVLRSRPRYFLSLAFVTRFAWLTCLFPFAIWLASWLLAPDLFGNLFVLASTGGFFFAGLVSAAVGVATWLLARLAVTNAPFRFAGIQALASGAGVPRRRANRAAPVVFGLRTYSPAVWGLVAALAIPVPLACLLATYPEIASPSMWAKLGSTSLYAVSVAGGFLFAILLCLVASWAQSLVLYRCETLPGILPLEWLARRRRRPVSRLYSPLRWLLLRGFGGLGPGYVRPGGGRLRRGHGQAALLSAVLVVGYFVVYAGVVLRQVPLGEDWLPPIVTVGLFSLMLGLVLAAAAFYLDYYNAPVIPVFALVSFVLFWLNDADHFYYIDPEAEFRQDLLTVFKVVGLAAAAAVIGLAAFLAFRGRIAFVALCALAAALMLALKWTATPPRGGLVADQFEWPTLDQLSQNWDIEPVGPEGERERVLVVVSAAGGGLQATAWTARVLTGLHERYGARFTRSIRFISAVSGGSLGVALYLANWDDLTGQHEDPFREPADDDTTEAGRKEFRRLNWINEASRRSCLGAAVWGVAFPDFLRFAFPPAVPDHIDRGWAIERSWQEWFQDADDRKEGDGWLNEKGADWRLMQLSQAARDGTMPVVVFNATLAETGRRLLISPSSLDTRRSELPYGIEFLHLFPDGQSLRVSTAVRLSASFPFVSPISRPRYWREYDPTVAEHRDCHVVDGGYVDNGGVSTAIDAIDNLLRLYRHGAVSAPFDRVILLRIMPFPSDESPDAQRRTRARQNQGWVNEVAGPISAYLNVRTTSQQERNIRSVERLRYYNGPHFPLSQNRRRIEVQDIPFYYFADSGVRPPLSWSLTPLQQSSIDAAWKQHCDYPLDKVSDQRPVLDRDYPLEKLDAIFK